MICLVPLEVIHYREWLGERLMEVARVNESCRQVVMRGGQVILRNRGEGKRICRSLRAGVYRYDGEDGFVWQRSGYRETRLSRDKIVLANGGLGVGVEVGSRAKLGRLIFGREVLDGKEMNGFARLAVDWAKKMMFD